jgi:hypothetical protein
MDFRHIFKKYIPLIASGCIGALFALFFYPLQKEIDQHFWNKQNNILVNQNVIERRLDLLNNFIEEFTKYDWCSIRAGVINMTETIEEEPLVCYQKSSASLLGLALKAKYYYGADVNNEFDNFAVLVQKYEDDVKKGDLESDSGKNLRNSASKIISLMQKTILDKFN